MKLVNILKEIVDDVIYEIAVQTKGVLGSGGYKDVYASKTNPNIVYKVGDKSDLEYEQSLFNEYPNLFCKTYGEVKKLKHPKFVHSSSYGTTLHNYDGSKTNYVPSQNDIDEKSYYLWYERLDTKRFEKFHERISQVFLDSDYDFNEVTLEASRSDNKKEGMSVLLSMKDVVKENASDLYNDYVNFINLFYKLINLPECNHGCDFNIGNFGYDKNGKLKSLDI